LGGASQAGTPSHDRYCERYGGEEGDHGSERDEGSGFESKVEVVCSSWLQSFPAQRLVVHSASNAHHIHLLDDRNWLGGGCGERKQRCRRPLVPGQRAPKNGWLIDDVAASEVADRHDQGGAAVAAAEIELDGIRPSAAVPSFGVCPEPSPIEPADMPEATRHSDHDPISPKKVASLGRPSSHNRALWEQTASSI
jgi:hypothetical protein